MADHARDFRLAIRLGKQEHAGIEAAVMENRVANANNMNNLRQLAQKNGAGKH